MRIKHQGRRQVQQVSRKTAVQVRCRQKQAVQQAKEIARHSRNRPLMLQMRQPFTHLPEACQHMPVGGQGSRQEKIQVKAVYRVIDQV